MQHFHVFSDLPLHEKEQLIRFPVYLSLLAASKDHHLDKQEKNTAVKLTHIKTFACDHTLADYYAAVEENFESSILQIEEELPKEGLERELAIRRELNKLRAILRQLDQRYVTYLYDSLRSYTDQVARAHRNILEYFLFPLPIKGLTD